MAEVFCRGEFRNCPAQDFENLPVWGLCHTKNLPDGTSRHTVAGTFIPDDPPPPPGAPSLQAGPSARRSEFEFNIPDALEPYKAPYNLPYYKW